MQSSKNSNALDNLKFENTVASYFEFEVNKQNEQNDNPHQVRGYYFSKVIPVQSKNPRIIGLSNKALNLIDLSEEDVQANLKKAEQFFSGNLILNNSQSFSHCYCGHQFGNWAGQLGDGRAISLGDIRNSKGELWELQLKGAGKTPYSRFADGRAVLRSSIREFLISEHMEALGIPTTRACSIVLTDDKVDRDIFYNGNVRKENCSIVCRMAPSFIRFGSFQVCNKPSFYEEGGPSHGLENEMIPQLLDYLIEFHFPLIKQGYQPMCEWDRSQNKRYQQRYPSEAYFDLYKEVVDRTAKLVALWQGVGFCHGVLNTDNMSILGLTIDYGPFGFMDHFDKDFICNHSDRDRGRYRYDSQPSICKWNLQKLAESLQAVVPLKDMMDYLEQNYDAIFDKAYYEKFSKKVGLKQINKKSIDDLLDLMHFQGSDFTNTFRKLADIEADHSVTQKDLDTVDELLSYSAPIDLIMMKKKPELNQEYINKLKLFQQQQPGLFQRMGLTNQMIVDAERDIEQFEKMSKQDFNQQLKEYEQQWMIWIGKYKDLINQDLQQIHENDRKSYIKERVKIMNQNNPRVVFRNYVAQDIIEKVEQGNFTELREIQKILNNPYDEPQTDEYKKYCKLQPKDAYSICVSCSS